MHYDMLFANADLSYISDVSVVSHKSLDFVIDKFLAEAVNRMKEDKLTIPEALETSKVLIVDSNNNTHGFIVGVANDNHPKGLFVVILNNRNVMRMYNFNLKMVGRKSLA